jgi:hypothetical protein
MYDERVVGDQFRLRALHDVLLHDVFPNDGDRVVGRMLDARPARRAQGARHDQILITGTASVNSSLAS